MVLANAARSQTPLHTMWSKDFVRESRRRRAAGVLSSREVTKPEVERWAIALSVGGLGVHAMQKKIMLLPSCMVVPTGEHGIGE